MLDLFSRAERHGDRIAIVAPEGVFTYADLTRASATVAARLLAGRDDLEGARICFLVPPGWNYVATMWGVWQSGGLAVPLAVSHPADEIAHVLDDADPEAVVVHPSLLGRVRHVADQRRIPVLQTPALLAAGPRAGHPELGTDRPAMMLYTSGTTGRPKGVVITHANVEAQVGSLVEAWGWTQDDHALLHLPLHHVHGIVNVLICALWSGAVCQILPRFEARLVWEALARGDVTVYMSVPTVYRRLLEAWDGAEREERERWSASARRLRLMVSGSAALPVGTLERWEEATGHRLLERYGMTEIGMALSNPLAGERRPGHVGTPLPGVEVRLVDEAGAPVPAGVPGEIQVRGRTVFREYWRRPEDTAAAFTPEGWFRTGDEAVVEDGSYRIMGRSSVDILKTGGEKVSALEVEDALREHREVLDVAVVGVPDAEWGERVCAAVIPDDVRRPPSPEELRTFAKRRLAPYKVPKEIRIVERLPRNAMGKVTKRAVRDLFVNHESGPAPEPTEARR